MKRTGEVILTTIALFFTYLGTILISTVLLFSNLDEIRKLFQEDYVKEETLPVTFESIDAFKFIHKFKVVSSSYCNRRYSSWNSVSLLFCW